jgi:hypothetical protein
MHDGGKQAIARRRTFVEPDLSCETVAGLSPETERS